jgi:hypothetical protein
MCLAVSFVENEVRAAQEQTAPRRRSATSHQETRDILMILTKLFTSSIICAACGALSACRSDSASSGGGASSGSSVAARRCVDACKAITDDEVKGLLGVVDKPGGSAGLCVAGADATTSSCQWSHGGGLSLQVYSESDTNFETQRKIQKASAGYQEIPGIGDGAFKGTLGVSKGGTQIFFRSSGLSFQLGYSDPSRSTASTPPDVDQKLQTVAKAIIGRANSL